MTSAQSPELAAYDCSKRALPPYVHCFSPKKLAQHQIFARLVLNMRLRPKETPCVAMQSA